MNSGQSVYLDRDVITCTTFQLELTSEQQEQRNLPQK